jgi:hypothetical protein
VVQGEPFFVKNRLVVIAAPQSRKVMDFRDRPGQA